MVDGEEGNGNPKYFTGEPFTLHSLLLVLRPCRAFLGYERSTGSLCVHQDSVDQALHVVPFQGFLLTRIGHVNGLPDGMKVPDISATPISLLLLAIPLVLNQHSQTAQPKESRLHFLTTQYNNTGKLRRHGISITFHHAP